MQKTIENLEYNIGNLNEALKNSLNEVGRVQIEYSTELWRHKETKKKFEQKSVVHVEDLKKQDNYIISLMNQITFLTNKEEENLLGKKNEKNRTDSPTEKLKRNHIY